ncbi:L28 family ribosomal protein, partial [Deinococcus sp. GbtcB9]|uniref:L28 family ribosomal protein n=1 Tax=Deinococcus sp. GbtcB9 TaxID=2824754 RepID=UPI001C3060BA
ATRRGKARAQGGEGRKVTGVTMRVQRANLHKRTIREGGVTKTVWLSADALRTLSRGPYRGIELLCSAPPSSCPRCCSPHAPRLAR